MGFGHKGFDRFDNAGYRTEVKLGSSGFIGIERHRNIESLLDGKDAFNQPQTVDAKAVHRRVGGDIGNIQHSLLGDDRDYLLLYRRCHKRLSALLEYEMGAQITLNASWDVWKHGHPAIELYGTEGSMRVPDPDSFGGDVEVSDRDGAWQAHSADTMPFGERNWRHPRWPAERPDQANWRCLGLAVRR